MRWRADEPCAHVGFEEISPDILRCPSVIERCVLRGHSDLNHQVFGVRGGLTGRETVAAGVALQLLLAVFAVKVIFAGRAEVHWKRRRKAIGVRCSLTRVRPILSPSFIPHSHWEGQAYVQNSLEGGREGVLTGVEAVRVLMRRKTGWRRCRRWARQLAASGVFFQ